MRSSILRIGLAAALAVTACSTDDDPTPPPEQQLVVTVAPLTVRADGVATVTVSYSGATRTPVTLTTTRGRFVANGEQQLVLSTLTGTAALQVCDGLAPGCVGNAYVSVQDAAAITGFVTVQFLGVEQCANGVDDTADGLADCADAYCSGRTCTTAAGGDGTCQGSACVCVGGATTETVCDDGADGDCDGATDCADSDCADVTCVAAGGGIGACSGGACVCTPSGGAEAVCNDDVDNDCDGGVDCADASCDTRACATGGRVGVCSGGTCIMPACVPSATTETACMGGVDEDCDGTVDCGDADCADASCAAAPTFVCQAGACTDTASGYAFSLAPVRTRLPAIAGSATDVIVTVTRDGQPEAGMTVALTASRGTLSTPTIITDAVGKATVRFTAPAGAGLVTLTGTMEYPPLVATATIDLPALGSIALNGEEAGDGMEYTVMGVARSGWREQNNVTVKLLDVSGQKYPAGLQVRFEHRALNGSRISGPTQTDAACGAPCMYAVATTDEEGLARTILYSGTQAGTLELSASATAGGESRAATLPGVPVVGARASAGAFTVVCDPQNNRGFQNHNCGVSLEEGQYTCVALLQDRYQNMLGTATPVTFVSETSRVGMVARTPAFDASQEGAGQADLGRATQIFQLLGGYLPEDVPAVAGEPSAVYDDVCGAGRTHNPRDGVVSVIAVADGEEAFTDLDGDGVYDAGEPFVDLAEPFADYDDDGTQDAGEWFQDVNGDGGWDGPNGVWDAATKIWTQTVVLYSGAPAPRMASGANYLGSRWVANYLGATHWTGSACTPTPAAPNFAVLAEVPEVPEDTTTIPPTPAIPAQPATSKSYVVVASDGNLNMLATDTTYEIAALEPTKIETFYYGLDQYVDTTGMFFRYWPCDQAGRCATRCAATGTDAPCEMVPSITGYSCGIAAGVRIVGGSEPSGAETVEWTVTLPPSILGVPLSGTNN